MSSKPFHSLDVAQVLRELDVDPEQGLSTAEVERRRARYGENRVALDAGTRPLLLLVRQFTDVMIIVLLVAAVVAGLIGEAIDAVAILVIVVLNGLIGFIQDFRAERALQALQAMSAPQVRVLREGRRLQLAEAELVPGDVVLLEAGDVVPADLRLFRASALTVDEAPLTGESVPVLKNPELELAPDVALAERATMAHKGTHVTGGHTHSIAVATGAATELGRIATLMRERERPMTPLQRRLASFGRRLSAAALAICGLILVIGLLRGEPPLLMLLTAISLAVAAIPEALPAVVTISLALGARRMAARNALMRRLPAIETLGSVTVICCDKTGTLTQNAMRAERFHAAGRVSEWLPAAPEADGPWYALCRAMALNTNAKVGDDGALQGDPTEVALLEAAREAGFKREALEQSWPRVGDIAFEAGRRRMATLHQGPEGALVIVKGAPEAVLPLCRDQRGEDGPRPLDPEGLLEQAHETALAGYRVLAFAEREPPELPDASDPDQVERDLTFLGLVALADPPRPRARSALASCASAGIAVNMITGDHPATARAIASRLGIISDHDGVVTGQDLHEASDAERREIVARSSVYARVSPEQKLDIVTALQEGGAIVAMTGDGVNDAPALKRADIGVAMGQQGTDVAREAADAVLLDDDFATIVDAVREGRRIYDNVRKFISYTMTSNSGEIWTILLAPFLGLPLPLLPIQILWINLVTDGLPGLALGVEPEERNVMDRPPRPPRESVFAHGMWQHMLGIGLLIGGLSLGAQAWAYHRGSENWQTVVFTVLTLSQLVHALVIRSERDSIFTIGWLSNLPLFLVVLLTLGLQLAVVYVGPLQTIFHTTGLAPDELVVVLTLPWVVMVVVEIEKWGVRRGLLYVTRPRTAPGSP